YIVEDGLRRMYGESPENVFYYLTVYNEPVVQPTEPNGLDVPGLLRVPCRYRAAQGDGPRVQLLASGTSMQWALRAAELLAQDWGVAADVWSATSWGELRREALACEEYNLLRLDAEPKVPYVTRVLSDAPGPVVAVSDFMKAVPDLISRWVPGDWTSLGTDGFGLSDTRGALRRHFHVDAESIAVAALRRLAARGEVPATVPADAARKYAIADIGAAPAGETAGSSE